MSDEAASSEFPQVRIVLNPAVDGAAVEGLPVESWLAVGANETVTSEQVINAIGAKQLGEAAEALGVDQVDLAEALAVELPVLVDKASPDGTFDPNLAWVVYVPDVQPRVSNPQPMLTDIDIRADGSLDLGFGNRLNDMSSYSRRPPSSM